MLLEAAALGRTYPTSRRPIAAVAGIDLVVPAGEFLVICGRSGSGKSTLLGMLGGLCRPTRGRVAFDGHDLWSHSAAARADLRARRIGFMFQNACLLPNLRAADNVALPALLAGSDYESAYNRTRDLLARLDLEQRWDAYPAELSGGQQRRVACARALVNRPTLLLADEPTNDLDDCDEREVLALLRSLTEADGTTLIVVTHDESLARRADRVITLRAGRVFSDMRNDECRMTNHEGMTNDEFLMTNTDTPAVPIRRSSFDIPSSFVISHSSFAEPAPLGSGLRGFLFGFAGWVLLVAGVLFAVDQVAAHFQSQAVAAKQTQRRRSQELALQQLRADLEDITYQPDGSYEVRLYLQNFDPARPFVVLGPSVRAFVQADQSWKEITATPVGFSEKTVRPVTDRQSFRFTIRADLPAFDELLQGYMHVRITNVMLVSEGADAAADIFERTDNYYAYVKPEKTTDDEVRRRNGWTAGALVPRWIGMPAH